MISEAHDVGNHTIDHLNLSTITAAQVDAEFAQNANALSIPQALGPGFTMSLYRAPFGVPYEADTNDVLRVAPVTAKYGVHIGWGIESNDWDCANSALRVIDRATVLAVLWLLRKVTFVSGQGCETERPHGPQSRSSKAAQRAFSTESPPRLRRGPSM